MEPRKILAVAWGVHSAFIAVVAVFFALWFGGFGVLTTVLPDSNTGEPLPPAVGLLLGGCGVLGGCSIFVGLLPGAVASVGLWLDTRWGRFGALVAAIFSLLSGFPAMLFGAATLVWLWKDHQAAASAAGGAADETGAE